MSQFEYSLDQLDQVAQQLSAQLPSKAVVLLDAEMGTGKTTLISQILQICVAERLLP